MSNRTADTTEPELRLSRDEFTTRRRELSGHPEAVSATARIDISDHYGNVTTWVRLGPAHLCHAGRGAGPP